MSFNDGLDKAIELLSTHSFVSMGECSASALVKCKGPTTFAKLYIAEINKLRDTEGTYEDGINAAIFVLSTNKVDRKGNLVPVDVPEQPMSLYISKLQGRPG